jgi:hypothetical protein
MRGSFLASFLYGHMPGAVAACFLLRLHLRNNDGAGKKQHKQVNKKGSSSDISSRSIRGYGVNQNLKNSPVVISS